MINHLSGWSHLIACMHCFMYKCFYFVYRSFIGWGILSHSWLWEKSSVSGLDIYCFLMNSNLLHIHTQITTHPFVYPSICSFIHSFFIHPFTIHSFLYLFIHPSIHSSIHLSIHPSILPFIHPFIYPLIYLLIHPFIHLSTNLSTHWSIYLSIYLSNHSSLQLWSVHGWFTVGRAKRHISWV